MRHPFRVAAGNRLALPGQTEREQAEPTLGAMDCPMILRRLGLAWDLFQDVSPFGHSSGGSAPDLLYGVSPSTILSMHHPHAQSSTIIAVRS